MRKYILLLLPLLFYSSIVSAQKKGPFDKYDKITRLLIDVSSRKYRIKYQKGDRFFKVLITGRFSPEMLITELPKWAGKLTVEAESGPLTLIEIHFPNAYTEAFYSLKKNKLEIIIGTLRKEFYLKQIAEMFLAQSYDVPENKEMKVYVDVENLIASGEYDKARKILLKLPLGHGNGLRGLRLGDIEMLNGKLATSKRNYDGVVRRYGNVFFAIMARFHLFVLDATLYGKKPNVDNLDTALNTLRPLISQYSARVQTASGLYRINMFKEALKILIPVSGNAAENLRQKIIRDYIFWHYANENYTKVVIMYEHYSASVNRSPWAQELNYKSALAMMKSGYYTKAVRVLREELKKHGKWMKYQVFPEKAFAALAVAYAHSENLFKAKASIRFYLENKPASAPHASEIWELFGRLLLKERRFKSAHTAFLASLKSDWNRSHAIKNAFKFSVIAFKSSRYAFIKDYFEFIITPDYNISDAEDVFVMLYKSAKSAETLDEIAVYCKNLSKLSVKMEIICAETSALLGDVTNEYIMLEYATAVNDDWSILAEERIRYLNSLH